MRAWQNGVIKRRLRLYLALLLVLSPVRLLASDIAVPIDM